MPFIAQSLYLSESDTMVLRPNKNCDIFMTATTTSQGLIKGESEDAKHKDKIILSAYQYGMCCPYDAGSAGMGGKRQHRPLRILKQTDTSTVLLYKAACENDALKEVKIFVRKLGSKDDFLTIALAKAYIIDFKFGMLTTDDVHPMDLFSLVFKDISIQYRRQKSDGSLGPPFEYMDSDNSR